MSEEEIEAREAENWEVVDKMSQYGGSFVKALAECFRRADSMNFVRLQIAFSDYWDQYKNFDKQDKA